MYRPGHCRLVYTGFVFYWARVVVMCFLGLPVVSVGVAGVRGGQATQCTHPSVVQSVASRYTD
jgi:hypothetical protein